MRKKKNVAGHCSGEVNDVQCPDLLKLFITNDESWVYDYDIEIKAQLSRFATIETIMETGPVGDIKKLISEVFRGLEKTLT